MGMNVNGLGMNNTYAVQNKVAAAPQYASAPSFAGGADVATFSTKQEGTSTAKKIAIAGGIAAVVTTIIAASRGKKINTANKAAAGLFNNIGTGFKSIFTKAGRADYASALKKLAKGTGKKGAKAATVAQSTIDAAKEARNGAQKELKGLQRRKTQIEAWLKDDDALKKAAKSTKKNPDGLSKKEFKKALDEEYKELTGAKFGKTAKKKAAKASKLGQAEKTYKSANKKAKNLATKGFLDGDKTYKGLTKTKDKAQKEYDKVAKEVKKLNKGQKGFKLSDPSTWADKTKLGDFDTAKNALDASKKDVKDYKQAVKTVQEARMQRNTALEMFKEAYPDVDLDLMTKKQRTGVADTSKKMGQMYKDYTDARDAFKTARSALQTLQK